MKTNEEIKKGLEHCFNGLSCEPCPYNGGETPAAVCDDHLGRDALELIKQQEQKIEELTAENEALKAEKKARGNIVVKVDEYCQNCPEFEAYLMKTYSDDSLILTTVCCTHSARCKRIYQKAKEEAEREAEK